MCGIVGFIFKDKREVSGSVLRDMTDKLVSRGPDSSGYLLRPGVGLGHRRLSIIDLASGSQPMSNALRDIHIVFNGEIYNFLELKFNLESAGYLFKTNSDTEVILACYEFYGESFVRYLNGMFSIAIWDGKADKLLLARDRVGEKPLYYYIHPEGIVFSSELKSLLAFPDLNADLDEDSVLDYFTYGYIPEPNTVYSKVKKLTAATIMVYNLKCFKVEAYWKLPLLEPVVRDEIDYIEELQDLLEDSVRIRMISDVPIGVFLSGGLDSSAVTGLMAKLSDVPVKTFSVRGGEGNFDELKYARAVSKLHGTEHHEYEMPSEGIESLIPDLVKYLDEPFGDSSILPTYHVSRLARQHVTVALSGEGGDELFAGYDWHRKYLTISEFSRSVPLFLRSGFFSAILPDSSQPRLMKSRYSNLLFRVSIANRLSLLDPAESYKNLISTNPNILKDLVFTRAFFDRVITRSRKPVEQIFDESRELSPLTSALRADFSLYLPGDLLTKVDRMSMMNSLEVRTPLLDYRLAEFSSKIPDSMKLKGGISKYLLKKAAGSLLPSEVRDRKTKRGFSVPVSDWFRGEHAEFARGVLLDSEGLDFSIFNRVGIETMLKRHASGDFNYGPQLWYLLIYALWFKNQKFR
jgi:asparagine synthase (glutamine-hydrolysing)